MWWRFWNRKTPNKDSASFSALREMPRQLQLAGTALDQKGLCALASDGSNRLNATDLSNIFQDRVTVLLMQNKNSPHNIVGLLASERLVEHSLGAILAAQIKDQARQLALDISRQLSLAIETDRKIEGMLSNAAELGLRAKIGSDPDITTFCMSLLEGALSPDARALAFAILHLHYRLPLVLPDLEQRAPDDCLTLVAKALGRGMTSHQYLLWSRSPSRYISVFGKIAGPGIS